MSAILNLISLTVASGDATASSNPSLKYVDWSRQVLGIPVKVPSSTPHEIGPGVEKLIFDGTRSITSDGTTAWDLALSLLASDRYRFTHSAGTNPTLRTARVVPVNGVLLTLVVNSNGSVTITAGAGTPFATVVAGDVVFVPGAATGDPVGAFMVINQGFWQVIGATGAVLTLVRPTGQDFEALGEAVTPMSDAQFMVFTSTGVQVGDKMEVSVGFSASALRTYEIVAVTNKWVEVLSTTPLAAQAGILPGAVGLQFYTSSKRFVRIEADQECVVRANGDVGSTQRISPWLAGDPAMVGEYVKVGAMWSLKILNRSSVTLNCTIITAE